LDVVLMSKAARTGRSGVRYRIVIRGTLGQPFVGPLEGMTAASEGDQCVLAGDVVDQSHLRGIIAWLTELGVEIVSINPAPEPGDEP
jgi:hypothetical protein